MHRQKHSTDAPPSSVLHLTPEDVKLLLSPETAQNARGHVAGKVVGAYAAQKFAPGEAVIAEQIFRLLVQDTEVKIRAMLSEQLKSSRTLPRDIVLTMARDVKEVALPVLRYSEVLSEEDLIDLVRTTQDTERHIAIGGREVVTGAVASELVRLGAPEVAQTLLENGGAQITDGTLERIVSRFSGSEALMSVMARRERLPVTVAEKVAAAVSGKLAEGLRSKYRLAPEQLANEETRAQEHSTLALLKGNPGPEETERLVNQLYAFQRLTPNLILTALAEGHVLFFEQSLARMAGIRLENARTLINDRGDLGFRALYNKSGLPVDMFGAVRLLLVAVNEVLDTRDVRRGSACAGRVIERLRQYAQDGAAPNTENLIRLIRQGHTHPQGNSAP